MKIRVLEPEFTVCKVDTFDGINLSSPFVFTAATDEEKSLVCPTISAPARTLEREDGWRAFRIQGTLEFSLVGILSRMSGAIAAAGIGLFAVSTFNTDYLLVKDENLSRALDALRNAGFECDAPVA